MHSSPIPSPTESLEPCWVPAVKGYREDTVLAAVEACEKCGAVILGGDVYGFYDGTLSTEGHNWYSEQKTGESFAAWSSRSAQEARTFLTTYRKAYRVPDDHKILFELVIRERE